MRHSLHLLRLGAFPLGLGLASVLVGGTLNRVLIVEAGLPAALVGLLFAIPVLLAPARIALGHLTDSHPLRGERRAPYIALGASVAGVAMTAAVLVLLRAPLGLPGAFAGLLLFAIYGVGYGLASTAFEALLADKFRGAQRPRAVTLSKVAMFGGILGGAVILGRLLDPFDPARLAAIAAGVMLTFALLSAIAVSRQEVPLPVPGRHGSRAENSGLVALIRRVVWADRQARRFFVVIVLSVLGTQAQDVLLEPYGGLALGLSVAQTTRLTAIWGAGTLLALMLAGTVGIPRLGYALVLRAGLRVNIAVFVGLILAGALGSAALFRGLVFALGLGTGLAMAGLLTAVIEYTTFARAGLLMGVWGTAAELGQASGMLISGVLVDLLRALGGGNVLLAYGGVFALEALLLARALWLVSGLDIARSAALREEAPHWDQRARRVPGKAQGEDRIVAAESL